MLFKFILKNRRRIKKNNLIDENVKFHIFCWSTRRDETVGRSVGYYPVLPAIWLLYVAFESWNAIFCYQASSPHQNLMDWWLVFSPLNLESWWSENQHQNAIKTETALRNTSLSMHPFLLFSWWTGEDGIEYLIGFDTGKKRTATRYPLTV